MFGSQYSENPEILLDSFDNWEEGVEKKAKIRSFRDYIRIVLMKSYVNIFGAPHIGSQLRFLHFQKILRSNFRVNPKSILDTGCGIGLYSFWLKEKYPKSEVIGCDIDKKKINFCNKYCKKKKINGLNFIYKNIESEISKQSKYDLIINVDVLEHVKDHEKVLNNFYGSLVKGGFLYLHVPCPNQKLIFKEFSQYHYRGHVTDGFTIDYLNKKLGGIGFKIIKSQKTFGFFGTLAWEINFWTLSKNYLVAGLFYPFLYFLSKLDLYFRYENDCGIAILARK